MTHIRRFGHDVAAGTRRPADWRARIATAAVLGLVCYPIAIVIGVVLGGMSGGLA